MKKDKKKIWKGDPWITFYYSMIVFTSRPVAALNLQRSATEYTKLHPAKSSSDFSAFSSQYYSQSQLSQISHEFFIAEHLSALFLSKLATCLFIVWFPAQWSPIGQILCAFFDQTVLSPPLFSSQAL